jgi:RimJ/RimL family protein N-acetyltransferase
MDGLVADPPYTIRTERLLLRCWEPRDAPALGEAITASLDHLRPWMPWAHAEPVALDDRVALLRRFRGDFDLGRSFVFGVLDPDGTRVLGGTGLHPRAEPGTLEIGYWIRADSAGRGYATELTAALARVAIEHCGAERVDIRVDRDNHASLAIPRRLGFTEEATLRCRLEPGADGVRRDAVVFSLFAEELAASPAGAARLLECRDAAGRVVHLR